MALRFCFLKFNYVWGVPSFEGGVVINWR